MSDALAELQSAFDALFVAPFASHRWASRRGRSHWVELEGWMNSMAGPLSTIAESGGCGYVYPRDDWYFAAVSDPPSLRLRLLEWHSGLAAGVEQFIPATGAEAVDLEFMRSVASRMRVLVEQSCAVEQRRCQAAGSA